MSDKPTVKISCNIERVMMGAHNNNPAFEEGEHLILEGMSPIECLIYDLKRLNHLLTLLAMSEYMYQEDE